MQSSARQRRLPAEARRAAMIERAAEVFAAHGFAASTRDIAHRMGVAQALIYKYFASKEALIDAVLETRFLARSDGPDRQGLEGDGPLAERIYAFYASFAKPKDDVNLRLFLRAALDGLDFAARYRTRLDPVYIWPVVSALRREIGAPALGDAPPTDAEREVAMQMHGCLVFTRIRSSIYRRPPTLPLDEVAQLQARVFAAGAVAEMRRLHFGDGAV